jgi:serine protease Do
MSRSFLGRFRKSAAAGAVLAAALAALSFHQVTLARNAPEPPPLAERRAADDDASAAAIRHSFAPLVKQTAPAVVSILAVKPAAERETMQIPGFIVPPIPGGEQRQRGEGSGVIVGSDGYILTNHHVVEEAEKIEVRLSDKREFKAELIGSDAKTDIAVLKIEAKDLPVMRLGNSDNVAVGDVVLAVGNPFGIGQTVTMGIVGATGRGNLGIEDYEDFIQTDAAINPGNSGGALINYRGELVGVNTAILSRSGGNQGVGFAVPVNLAHHVMSQILEQGRVVRGFMGVGIQDVTPEIAAAFKVERPEGALVSHVEPDSPAAKAGLERGDIIREIDGEPMKDMRELRLEVAERRPGQAVELAVWRDGAERKLQIKLGEMPGEEAPIATNDAKGGDALGISVQALTPELAERLGVDPTTKGVVVSRVDPASPAAEAGLRRGDVIVEAERRPIDSPADLRQALAAASDDVLMLIQRGHASQFIVIERG